MTSSRDAITRYDEAYYATRNPIRSSVVGIKAPKHRPWAGDIDDDLRHLAAAGIDNRMNSRHSPQRTVAVAGVTDLEAIALSQVAAAFFLWLAGAVLAVVALCFELLQRRCESSDGMMAGGDDI